MGLTLKLLSITALILQEPLFSVCPKISEGITSPLTWCFTFFKPQKPKENLFRWRTPDGPLPSDLTTEPDYPLPRTGRARKEVKYFADSDEEDVDFAMFN